MSEEKTSIEKEIRDLLRNFHCKKCCKRKRKREKECKPLAVRVPPIDDISIGSYPIEYCPEEEKPMPAKKEQKESDLSLPETST